MSATTTKDNLSVFGNEFEIDGVLYVSVDFLKHYPEYLDNELDQEMHIDDQENDTDTPEEGEFDESLSTHKSEIDINGTTYIAVPVLKSNPNYVELKYNQKADVSLSTFIPNNMLKENAVVTKFRVRRRRSL